MRHHLLGRMLHHILEKIRHHILERTWCSYVFYIFGNSTKIQIYYKISLLLLNNLPGGLHLGSLCPFVQLQLLKHQVICHRSCSSTSSLLLKGYKILEANDQCHHLPLPLVELYEISVFLRHQTYPIVDGVVQ